MVRMIRTICTADPDPESGLLSSDGVKVLCDVVEDASGDDDVAVVGESVAFVTFIAAVDGVAVEQHHHDKSRQHQQSTSIHTGHPTHKTSKSQTPH